MKSAKSRVVEFLKSCRMEHEEIDFESCSNIFLEDMEMGLNGLESSLKMIPTYIDVERNIPVLRVSQLNPWSRRLLRNWSLYWTPGVQTSELRLFILTERADRLLKISGS